MLRLPILFVLAGITGFMLYKNENQRVPVGAPVVSDDRPMVGMERLPRVPLFDSDADFSDSDASLSDLDIRNKN